MILPNKVWIIGPPGVGKTTIASKLSSKFGVEFLELDNIYWSNNWIKKVNKANKFLESFIQNDCWIIDGYYAESAEKLFNRANIIFLVEVPYFLMMFRLIKRSFFRLIKRKKVCGENYENIIFLLSKKGIFNFAHTKYFFFKRMRRVRDDIIYVKNYEEIIKYIEI